MIIQKKMLIKIYVRYLLAIVVLKNTRYLIAFDFDNFNNVPYIYIPIAYLVVNFVFNRVVDKYNLNHHDYVPVIATGFTILNLIFKMPIIYTIFILIFSIYAKTKKTRVKEETTRYIKEYYERKNKEENQ